VLPVGGSCPAGYKWSEFAPALDVTKFLFRSYVYTRDNTALNFAHLVLGKSIQFGSTGFTPFVNPEKYGMTPMLCFIDVTPLDTNAKDWAISTVSETCQPSNTPGCPRFLSGGRLSGCTGASCMTPPVVVAGPEVVESPASFSTVPLSLIVLLVFAF
jgi:hypothetical protein